MLANIKNDLMYCLNILESLAKIKLYVGQSQDAEEFYHLNEQLNFNATLTLFANIGETVTKLSPELKNKYPYIAWQQVKDFRNKVVHDYIGLDIYIVYNIIIQELPPLTDNILQIIGFELQSQNFDLEEFKVAKNDFYYRHVPFERITYPQKRNPPS